MLEGLGLRAAEERLYRALLVQPGTSLAEAAAAAGCAQETARKLLAALEAKGLVSRSAGRPQRFLPADPEVALELLLLGREQELERARSEVKQFIETYGDEAKPRPGDIVEVVEGREAIWHRFVQLQRGAETELLAFDTPPYIGAVEVHDVQVEALRRGVTYRVVYDTAALDVPGQMEMLDTLTGLGEQARLLEGVPMKLAVADRRLALVPLTITQPHTRTDEALLVHPSSLLDALRMLFEALWERALPVPVQAGAGTDEAEDLSDDDRQLLTLLAAGLTDAGIATQLGVSPRTVERRISRLNTTLGVHSRFQLGLHAALNKWIGSTEASTSQSQ